ncbi:MAG TPA: FxLYD domain-containing protein [Terriglobia bacterium]|nr:FxLYD domain-containing protein [Terriglobia bacterium]
MAPNIHGSNLELQPSGRTRPVVVGFIVAILAIAAVVTALVLRSGSANPAPPPAMTADARGYLPQIEITGAQMSAAKNFLGDTVTYLDARATNQGSKTVRRVDLQLEFFDMLNQVVLRDAEHPISSRTPPLRPGETRAFRVSFEHMPADWNQAPPAITVKYVGF